MTCSCTVHASHVGAVQRVARHHVWVLALSHGPGVGHAGEAPPASQHALAEALVLGQGGHGTERLVTVVALDLLAAVRVHPLVSAQITELCVSLQTHLQQKKA